MQEPAAQLGDSSPSSLRWVALGQDGVGRAVGGWRTEPGGWGNAPGAELRCQDGRAVRPLP